MGTPLRVLIVDDCADDVELLVRHLGRNGFDVTWVRVDDEAALNDALVQQPWDVVLCDFIMPSLSGPDALQILGRHRPDLPVIVVSGQIGEEYAVTVMRAGARDYIRKDNLARLVPAVERELAEVDARRSGRLAQDALVVCEARFRTLAALAPVAILQTDAAGHCVYVNDRWGEITGRPIAAALGDTWLETVHPDDREPAARVWHDIVRSGQRGRNEYRVVRPDGSVRRVLAEAVPMRAVDGTVLGYVGTLTDITERVATAEPPWRR